MPEDKKNQISDENLENLAGGAGEKAGYVVHGKKGPVPIYTIYDSDYKQIGTSLSRAGATKKLEETGLKDPGFTLEKYKWDQIKK